MLVLLTKDWEASMFCAVVLCFSGRCEQEAYLSSIDIARKEPTFTRYGTVFLRVLMLHSMPVGVESLLVFTACAF